MKQSVTPTCLDDTLQQTLGYLNFSNGSFDATFFTNLNRIAASLLRTDSPDSLSSRMHALLQSSLSQLVRDHDVFRDSRQVERVLELTFHHVLPAYRLHHRDLIFDGCDSVLFNSFFIGRVCQAILEAFHSESTDPQITQQALLQLNDYIGYRPVAVLESQNIQPYEGEWSRPVPIYIRDVGPAVGCYHGLVERTIDILRHTDPQLLRVACFSLDRLDELAIDPRSFDFEHPANKRPNHHFGQWDPHCQDQEHYYRRFVVHRITLDALLARVENGDPTARQELLYEAAAALGGTILMAAGVSGSSPFTYDSNTTLESLMPIIAEYRDAYYQQLLKRLSGRHKSRLTTEAEQRHQPFGGARQHLNAQLAEQRAAQLIQVHLATAFARMGYVAAAQRHAEIIQVPSARIRCQIDCLITTGLRKSAPGNSTRH